MATASASFVQTEQDILDSHLHFSRTKPLSQPLVRAAALFGVIAAAGLLLALGSLVDAEPVGVAVGLTMACAFAFVALLLLLAWWRAPASTTKLWLQSPQLRPRLLGPQAVNAGPHGLSWTHPLGGGTITWAGVSRVDRSPEGLYVFLGPWTFIGIPARAFPNAEHMEYFAALADYYRLLPAGPTAPPHAS